MTQDKFLPPQLVTQARMLYLCWVPADPDAAAALLPSGLKPADNGAIYLNQYVVDRPEQTSHFGAYSLTYMGLDLAGLDLADGTPGRYWTGYYNSNAGMRGYAAESGIPAEEGKTVLELNGDRLIATTESGGVPIIRTEAIAGSSVAEHARGHLRYIVQQDGTLMSGRYAYVGDMADPFEVLSVEFLDPNHPTWAIRPASSLEITFGFYSPCASFCYPGGVEPLVTVE